METTEKGECPHTDDNDRKFHVTVTDVELSDALEQGYKVLKVRLLAGSHFPLLDIRAVDLGGGAVGKGRTL